MATQSSGVNPVPFLTLGQEIMHVHTHESDKTKDATVGLPGLKIGRMPSNVADSKRLDAVVITPVKKSTSQTPCFRYHERRSQRHISTCRMISTTEALPSLKARTLTLHWTSPAK